MLGRREGRSVGGGRRERRQGRGGQWSAEGAESVRLTHAEEAGRPRTPPLRRARSGFQVPAFCLLPELACQPHRQRPNLFFFAG